MERRNFLMSAGAFSLMSCMASYPRASTEQIRRAYYHHNGPPMIALLSMVREENDKSEHTGILISGNQRVLYDPAGSYDPSTLKGWEHPPRRDDIHYGMTEKALRQYERYHARVGFYIEKLEKEVPLEVANLAIKLSEEKGETSMTQCANSASWVLQRLPGFESVDWTVWPDALRRDFKALPGVKTVIIREDDVGQNYDLGEDLETELSMHNDAPPTKPTLRPAEG